MKTRRDAAFSSARRRLMAAGAVGVALPAIASRFTGADAAPFAIGAGQPLVLSGRVLGAGGVPLAGALIEVWHAAAGPVTTTADGDGRFLLSTVMPPDALSYRVGHAGQHPPARVLRFASAGGPTRQGIAPVVRDEAGVWRAACGLEMV